MPKEAWPAERNSLKLPQQTLWIPVFVAVGLLSVYWKAIATSTTTAENTSGAGMAMAMVFLTPKETRSWPVFNGSDKDWEEWAFSTEAALGDLGWGPMLATAKNSTDELDILNFDADATRTANNLYSLVAQSTRGKAQTLARLQPDANGLEVWRLLWDTYRPKGAEPAHAQMTAIIQPRWWSSAAHK